MKNVIKIYRIFGEILIRLYEVIRDSVHRFKLLYGLLSLSIAIIFISIILQFIDYSRNEFKFSRDTVMLESDNVITFGFTTKYTLRYVIHIWDINKKKDINWGDEIFLKGFNQIEMDVGHLKLEDGLYILDVSGNIKTPYNLKLKESEDYNILDPDKGRLNIKLKDPAYVKLYYKNESHNIICRRGNNSIKLSDYLIDEIRNLKIKVYYLPDWLIIKGEESIKLLDSYIVEEKRREIKE